jgi:hypothetical protein
MAAPTPTARQAPNAIMLKNGQGTLVTFASDPDISFKETSVTPGGWDNGDPVDITTHFDSRRRQKAPRPLSDRTNGTMTVFYDPVVMTQIRNIIGVETTITEEFPDGSTWADFGYLKSFMPAELSTDQGSEAPTAEIEYVYTGHDLAGAEQEPVVASVAGT